MLKENMVVLVGNGVQKYTNKIGKRHLEALKEACENNMLKTNKENELELALFLAENNFLTFLNTTESLIVCVPEYLNEYQINFLETNRKIFEEQDDWLIEVMISSKTPVDYNHRQYYRNLGIEIQIAKYEGKDYNSQLEMLYEELELQKNKKTK